MVLYMQQMMHSKYHFHILPLERFEKDVDGNLIGSPCKKQSKKQKF
jgi:hypothetical protein